MSLDLASLVSLALQYAPSVIGALLVLWLGRKIANRLGGFAESSLNKTPDAEPTLSRFVGSLVKFGILLVTVIAALTIIAVETSSLSAIILGFGAAMAFVLQGTLSNVASGVMLMLFRPFSIDDEVTVGGVSGKVTNIGISATRLKSVDNRDLIVSNSAVWGGTIINNSSLGERRLDMVFGISYDADIDKAIDVLKTTASQQALVKDKPEPWAKVVNLNESSVDLELRIWCDAADYKNLKVSLPQPVKEAFDKAGIGIPYPHEIKIKQNVKKSKARDRVARLESLRKA